MAIIRRVFYFETIFGKFLFYFFKNIFHIIKGIFEAIFRYKNFLYQSHKRIRIIMDFFAIEYTTKFFKVFNIFIMFIALAFNYIIFAFIFFLFKLPLISHTAFVTKRTHNLMLIRLAFIVPVIFGNFFPFDEHTFFLKRIIFLDFMRSYYVVIIPTTANSFAGFF